MKKIYFLVILMFVLFMFSGCLLNLSPMFDIDSINQNVNDFNVSVISNVSENLTFEFYVESPWLEHINSSQRYIKYDEKNGTGNITLEATGLNSGTYYWIIKIPEKSYSSGERAAVLINNVSDTTKPVITEINKTLGDKFNIKAFDNVGIKTASLEILDSLGFSKGPYKLYYNFNNEWWSDYISTSGEKYKITLTDYKENTLISSGTID